MNFLRKILTIAIVAVFTGNTEGMAHPVFDLPDDTPGLLHDRPNKNVCGQRKACVHVVIGNDRTYELVRNINDNNGEVGFDSIADDYQVYFPVDGTQPTTPEAVEYSLANIDNRENSPITEWYMMMFGVIPINHAAIAAGGAGAPAPIYVQAGWDNASNVQQPIIYLETNPGGGIHLTTKVMVSDVDNTIIDLQGSTRKSLWIDTFRKIAANPIGRILLYRLLIEIRRHTLGSNEGIAEQRLIHDPERHLLRSIRVAFFEEFMFSSFWKMIMFSDNKDFTVFTVSGPYLEWGKYITKEAARPLEVALFHEMVHWYQFLRYYDRTIQETNYISAGPFRSNIFDHYFTGSFSTEWQGEISNTYCVNEMRVILGISEGTRGFLNGDDISENLFRCSLRLQCLLVYMRYGYGDKTRDTENNRRSIAKAHWSVLCSERFVNNASNWPLAIGFAIIP